MKVTLDLTKRDAEIICEALNDWRSLQRRMSTQCKDSNPGRFNKRINEAFALESVFQEIVLK